MKFRINKHLVESAFLNTIADFFNSNDNQDFNGIPLGQSISQNKLGLNHTLLDDIIYELRQKGVIPREVADLALSTPDSALIQTLKDDYPEAFEKLKNYKQYVDSDELQLIHQYNPNIKVPEKPEETEVHKVIKNNSDVSSQKGFDDSMYSGEPKETIDVFKEMDKELDNTKPYDPANDPDLKDPEWLVKQKAQEQELASVEPKPKQQPVIEPKPVIEPQPEPKPVIEPKQNNLALSNNINPYKKWILGANGIGALGLGTMYYMNQQKRK